MNGLVELNNYHCLCNNVYGTNLKKKKRIIALDYKKN